MYTLTQAGLQVESPFVASLDCGRNGKCGRRADEVVLRRGAMTAEVVLTAHPAETTPSA
jgi:hypothetical protein